MSSELQALAGLGASLADGAIDLRPDLVHRARRLGDRLATGRFHVSILGEFNRGKSTLINALVGREVLPTGVVPVTAIHTEVHCGPLGARVDFIDGTRMPIDLEELRDYVTEGANPENERGVERVEVSIPSPLLAAGLVLVDTPGIGSIHRHNTDAARAALSDSDGAILVLAADAPLSDAERELVQALTERHARVFVVVNKADHLDPSALAEVRRFVRQGVGVAPGDDVHVWCVAARPALVAVVKGEVPGTDAVEFAAFQEAVREFVEHDLTGERLVSARRELATIGRELEEAITLRDAMLAFDAQTLTQRIDSFLAGAGEQQRTAVEDAVVLRHDRANLAEGIGHRLHDFARSAPRERQAALLEASRSLPRQRLEEELRALVEQWVELDFERCRRDEVGRVAHDWLALATRLRDRTEARVNAVRTVAADLFEIELPSIRIPEVTDEREQFSYLFVHVGSVNEDLERLGRRLLPERTFRRRAHRRAYRLMAEAFDRHAGRARADLVRRLDRVAQQFEQSMNDELALTVDHIVRAAHEAEAARQATTMRRERDARQSEHALLVARRAQGLSTDGEAPRQALAPGRSRATPPVDDHDRSSSGW